MTLDEIRHSSVILFECITGSRAYGTDTPESDTDIRACFVQPESTFLGLQRLDQVNNETNDICFYELGRFAELLAKNNPGLLEMLHSPADCVLTRSPLMHLLPPRLFLSRLCEASFANYAMSQIQKARGLNKKIANPMPRERRGVLDFCHVLEGQGSVPVARWLETRGWRQEHCGLVAVPHMRDVYGLYHDPAGTPDYRGILGDPDSTEVRVSRVPRDAVPAAWMSFNKDGFAKYCKDWREYWEWVGSRNEVRYSGTVAHGQGYDAKNLMHTFRLLDLAEEIATTGTMTVRTTRRDFLLRVKSGAFTYDALLAMAAERIDTIRTLFAKSDLPDSPDPAAIEHAVVEIRRAVYRGGA